MELRESDFDELVLKSDRPVLVDFWASWCPPCKMMQPVVDKLAHRVADWADVYAVNIDRCPSLAGRYEITGVPAFVAFADGQPVDRRTGALTESQLTALLTKAREAIANSTVDPTATAGEVQTVAQTEPAAPLSDRCDSRLSAGEAPRFITIVSGLPRSGTSLMMRMLNAGGIPALCDEQRIPDADNPNGYYEFEDVKSIQDYDRWIHQASGRSVKMVYSLLQHLPADRDYRVVFMRRHFEEILQSQKAMLERKGIVTEIPDARLKTLFEQELRRFYSWLPTQPHLRLINISYNELLSRPDSTIAHINRHLDYHLKTEAMTSVIDPSLYRNRAA